MLQNFPPKRRDLLKDCLGCGGCLRAQSTAYHGTIPSGCENPVTHAAAPVRPRGRERVEQTRLGPADLPQSWLNGLAAADIEVPTRTVSPG
jgi:hypothetical protein